MHIWWLMRQKQVSQTGISNCILQYSVGYKYLSLPGIPASGAKVLNTVGCNYLSLPEIPASGAKVLIHDDVIKWKHFPRNWPFVRGIHRSPVNSPHKGQWRGALMFSLICVWINGLVNNREAADLRRYRAHYDVTVMYASQATQCIHETHTCSSLCLGID